jgi:hypothetical protein
MILGTEAAVTPNLYQKSGPRFRRIDTLTHTVVNVTFPTAVASNVVGSIRYSVAV